MVDQGCRVSDGAHQDGEGSNLTSEREMRIELLQIHLNVICVASQQWLLISSDPTFFLDNLHDNIYAEKARSITVGTL